MTLIRSMKSIRRAVPLTAVAVLALTSCDIPATGVVEAGGPASGIPSTTAVYLVQDGALVVLARKVSVAGDVGTAVRALLQGPTSQERAKGVSTRLFRESQQVAETATEFVRVTTAQDTVHVELPLYTAKLTPVAESQLICTAARAYLLSRPDLDSVTVTVTAAGGRPIVGTDEGCPEL
jgi:hypothetical protein